MEVPRLTWMDVEWARGVLAALEQERTDILDEAASPLSQLEYAMLADNYRDIGLLKYGLGYPLSETHSWFAKSFKASLRVFELRGTQPAFDVTVIRGEESHPLREPGATDDSLTNSRRGLQAMYISLIAGGEALARQIVTHIWDPPDASYIGPDSEVCTPDDQQLAYAMKALLLDNKRDALNQLNRRPASVEAQLQAALIEALITNRKADFIAGFHELLSWHHEQIADPGNQKNVELYVSIPGLALCRQALAGGLIERGDLPEHERLLPLDLLSPVARF